MHLDENDSLHLSIRDYAPFHKEFVKTVIRKGDTVVDIGAHVGYYTLLFADLVGKNGKVFAFEPVPNTFKLLTKNIEENDYQNVTAIQKAVSNESKTTKLFLTQSATTHRISMSDTNEKYVNIETITLDDFFKNFDGKIDFIKCVSQGADYAVIQGMSDILKKFHDIKIMIAFAPTRLKEFGSDPLQFLSTLSNEGFNLYDISWQKKIIPTNSEELLQRFTTEKNNGTYIFCTREKLSLLQNSKS